LQTLVLNSPAGTFTTSVTIGKAAPPSLVSLSFLGNRDGAVFNAVTFQPGPFRVTTNGAPTDLAILATGLDLSAVPTVSIGGVPVPVVFFGFVDGVTGLEQINVQLVSSLAGAGRVPILVTSGGRTSDPVEIVILPEVNVSSNTDDDGSARSRELAALAYVPGTSLALVADENDDVIRVVDIAARRVIRTIALADGAEPSAIAVNSAGALAVITERGRDKVAILDLAAGRVLAEIAVGEGPSSVDITGALAVVVNQESNTVTILNFVTRTVIATVPVGKGPRSVSIDQASGLAYVTNQLDGTIYAIDIAGAKVVNSIVLEMNSRPQSIRVVQGQGVAIVTEPGAGAQGKVVLLGLNPASILGSFLMNPDDSGGSSDVAVFGSKAFFANQAGGTITIASVPLGSGPTTLKVDAGPRALAVDTKDNLLLIGSEGTGTIVLVDLSTQQIVGRINAILGENEEDDEDEGDHGGKHNNNDDRDAAPNLPVISRVSPDKANQGDRITITITGMNLEGATVLHFIDPDSQGRGRGNGQKKKGGTMEPGIVASNLRVNAAGTQITADVTIAKTVPKGSFVVQVSSPNGESGMKGSNTLKVN
jgi:YVTN family beta-propeller protein